MTKTKRVNRFKFPGEEESLCVVNGIAGEGGLDSELPSVLIGARGMRLVVKGDGKFSATVRGARPSGTSERFVGRLTPGVGDVEMSRALGPKTSSRASPAQSRTASIA